MKFLWTYMRKDRLLFFIAPLLMLCAVLIDLLQPTLMAIIVDDGIGKNDLTTVKLYGGFMLATTILGLLSGFACFYLSAKSTSYTGARLREDLFSHVLSFSAKELDHFNVSTLIVRLTNDIAQIQNALLMGQRMFIRIPFLVIGGLIMALMISPKLSVIFLVIIPFLVITIVVILKRAMKIFPVVQEKLDHLNLIARETLIGMRVVKGFSAEEREHERFSESNASFKTWQIKAINTMILLSPFAMLSVNFSIVFILWYGGYQVHIGALEIGKIMAFITYIMQILSAIMMSGMILMMFTRSQVSLNRIKEVFDVKPSIAEPINSQIPENIAIQYDDVSFFHHEGSSPVLSHISLIIPPGERLGIIGPTGSGKSTLVQLLPRLYDISSGNLLIGKVPINAISLKWLHQHIGFVEQDPTILAGSLRDNLALAKDNLSSEDLCLALDKAMATELYTQREEALDGSIFQRGQDLSGGQKQRVSIARVLAKKPSILIIDDSTSALDMLTEQAFLNNLDEDYGKQTQIIIAQRISTMLRCDRILVLNQGQIDAIGSHEQLIKTSDIYRTIAVSQLGEEVL